jgi:hypothetical protein
MSSHTVFQMKTQLLNHNSSMGSQHSLITRYFVSHIRHCHSQKIHYIMIWHLRSKSHSIKTYGVTGITEMDSVTESIYLGDSGEGRHHHIIRITHSFFS